MQTWIWIAIAVVLVAVLLIATTVWMARRRRTTDLRRTFGPEYDRTVERADDAGEAETELAERRERRETLNIKPLAAAARERYAAAWLQVQSRFVDDPATALRDGNGLVTDVMRARGYPVERFDDRTDTVSVDHPGVVEHYRAGHRIATMTQDGGASTEDMRQVLVRYCAMFDELLEDERGGRSQAG